MNKLLILKAFEKARKKKQEKGIKKPSLTDLAEELSNFIDETEGFKLGERSFRDYYNDANKLIGKSNDISIKQLTVINGLCKYLEFDNYQKFAESIDKEKEKSRQDKIRILVKKNKAVIIAMSILIIGFIVYNSVTRQRWMIWEKDHYKEVKFDAEKYDLNQLKLYKEERINTFKKVSVICSKTKFFNEDGSVNVWYGKNKNKKLEYFTTLGLHPETGKTLKPITQYMIDKYICD
ncbi:hypothetical protein [Psychroserpens sp.]|uniref:hypothetical protein n=1 Tax=Psychroserpens sp. TaxID=2020870 RepID=UPI002B268188|nr:hypothetical protein [Psychroserpens sp.]